MKARLTLKPGQRGTRKLTAQYGDRLLYVRYRYDSDRGKRLKTVELIVDETDWIPSAMPFPRNQILGVRVGVKERALQSRVKKAGGVWNGHRKVWELRYRDVLKLGIEDRIVEEGSSP